MSVRLPDSYTQQEFGEIVRDVQQAMAIEKLGLDNTTSTLVMRDRISKVVYARAMLEQLMHPRAQVGLEMQFLEVSRNDTITYGINFPAMFQAIPLTSFLNNIPALPSALTGLLGIGGGVSLIGIAIQGPALVAQMSKSTSKQLLSAELRSMSGQKATFHVGERYPIMTGGYGTATSATGTAGVTPAPSFTFQDLGLTLTVTPVVNDVDSVSLELEAQFQLLTGASINGLPVISSRSVKNSARLKFGDWALMSGLLTVHEARIVAGLAGISNIPFLGPLTSTHEHDNDTDQILVLLRPTLLGLPPSSWLQRAFRTGSETRPLTPL
jgi:general secretion pathway protein D